MSRANKQFASSFRITLFIPLLGLLVVVGMISFAGQSRAQTVEDLQAQIAELLATVTSLQQQLATLSSTSDVVSDFLFTRNLTIGDRGEEVRQLQIRLNQDSRTRVSEAGGGSPGNETTFFGEKTKAAVITYQELFASDILVSVGLTSGTGFVGPSTRAKLNRTQTPDTLADAQTGNDTSIETLQALVDVDNDTSVFQSFDQVAISFPSNYEGSAGDTLMISGIGFTQTGNTVTVGGRTIPNVTSKTGTEVSIDVPLDLEPGQYNLTVTNSNGVSNTSFFVVVDPAGVTPRIISIEPESGLYGTEVTIHGIGFTQTGNEIRLNYGVVSNVPSPDGTTVTFQVLPEVDNPAVQVGVNLNQGIEIPVWFDIVNANGITEQPGTFILTI